MTTDTFELPPLPDAIPIRTQLVEDGPEIVVGRGYSDEQMHEYARQAVLLERKRCAKLVEEKYIFNDWDQDQLAAAIRKGQP